MTQEQHPITTPLELFKQWEDDILNERDNVDHVLDCAWRDGFRAGADQELEACCEWAAEFEGAGDRGVSTSSSRHRATDCHHHPPRPGGTS